ncbi:MAG TPA: hypothetical protein VFB92_00865 [Vicinamibacterales bacterium]|nr:hypothetical protein [Vicinamibacterales bacterium]
MLATIGISAARAECRQQRDQTVVFGPFDQPRAHGTRNLDEHETGLVEVDLIPDGLSILGWERFEHECHVSGMHGAHPLVQLDEVLTMLKAFEQIALGTFLTMRQRFEDAMSVQQARDIVEALLKARLRPYGRHRAYL